MLDDVTFKKDDLSCPKCGEHIWVRLYRQGKKFGIQVVLDDWRGDEEIKDRISLEEFLERVRNLTLENLEKVEFHRRLDEIVQEFDPRLKRWSRTRPLPKNLSELVKILKEEGIMTED